MSENRLAGLSISIRITEGSMTNEPAIAIIFADPIVHDLEEMVLHDETLQMLVAKILANEEDDGLADCKHFFKTSLIADTPGILNNDHLADHQLKEENIEKRSLCDDPPGLVDDQSDGEEIAEKKEQIETEILAGNGEEMSWPFKKVSVFLISAQFLKQSKFMILYKKSLSYLGCR